jgi:hypothetical protein
LLKHINHTWKLVGDIYPLEEDSPFPEIQERKIKERKKQRKRDKKLAEKRGYKLESTLRFGKHYGKTLKEIIEKHRSYFDWMQANKVLLLHPDVEKFATELKSSK